MKKLLKILIPFLIVAVGGLIGYLIYSHTGIVEMVENKKKSEKDENVIAVINGRTLTEEEGRAYLISMRNQIEAIYGTEIWSFALNSDGDTYDQMLKESMYEKIKYIKLVCANAEAFEVSLSSDDLADINTYVTAFFAGISKETAEKYSLTTELMTKIYSENVLAAKVYNRITLNHNVDANENNCRQADFYKMEFKKYYLDDEGEPVYYSESELSDLKTKVASAYVGAQNTSFQNVALSFLPEDDYRVTCGRSDLPLGIAEDVMALKQDELSEVLETSDAWYIYKCVSVKNEEATKEAIQEKTEKDRDEYFKNLYENWYKNAVIEEDTAKWERLEY